MATKPTPAGSGQNTPDDETQLPDGITPDWLNELAGVLGLDTASEDAADPELILQAARDAVADGQNAGGSPSSPSQVAASAKRLGMELIDGDTVAALRRDAAEGRRVAAAAARRDREQSVDDAIRTGRITPGRREHWLRLLEADPGMADVLASTPAGTSVPLAELGHNHDAETAANGPQPVWFR